MRNVATPEGEGEWRLGKDMLSFDHFCGFQDAFHELFYEQIATIWATQVIFFLSSRK